MMDESKEAAAPPPGRPRSTRNPKAGLKRGGGGRLAIGQIYALLILARMGEGTEGWANGMAVRAASLTEAPDQGLTTIYEAMRRLMNVGMVEVHGKMDMHLAPAKRSEAVKYRMTPSGRAALVKEIDTLINMGALAYASSASSAAPAAPPKGKGKGKPDEQEAALMALLAAETGKPASIEAHPEGARLALPAGWGAEPLEIIEKPSALILRAHRPQELSEARAARRALARQMDLLSALEDGE